MVFLKQFDLENLINDTTTKHSFEKTRTGSIKNNICVLCGRKAKGFDDKLSRKEYAISGLCQKCQNETFGENDDPI